MADYAKILQALDETKLSLQRLEAEIVSLQHEAVPQTEPATADESAYFPPLVSPGQAEPIYGGTLTDDYPDCCALGNEFMGYFCTGTLIAANLVLTAKHCAQDYNVTRVFLRGNDVSQPEKGDTMVVAKTHPHPDQSVDLMLLVLEGKSGVTARAIVRDEQFQVKTATVVGFGMINPSGTKGFGRKRKASIPVMTLDCQEMEDQARYGCYAEFEMVAGHRGLKRDTCKGDSGGPLYVESAEGKILLLGVTSRGVRVPGKPCGNGGIYVRADRFRDWIRETTNIKV